MSRRVSVVPDLGIRAGLPLTGKVSELRTHSVILNNVETIPIKLNEELTLLEIAVLTLLATQLVA